MAAVVVVPIGATQNPPTPAPEFIELLDAFIIIRELTLLPLICPLVLITIEFVPAFNVLKVPVLITIEFAPALDGRIDDDVFTKNEFAAPVVVTPDVSKRILFTPVEITLPPRVLTINEFAGVPVIDPPVPDAIIIDSLPMGKLVPEELIIIELAAAVPLTAFAPIAIAFAFAAVAALRPMTTALFVTPEVFVPM